MLNPAMFFEVENMLFNIIAKFEIAVVLDYFVLFGCCESDDLARWSYDTRLGY